jgi:hypothetical protein
MVGSVSGVEDALAGENRNRAHPATTPAATES